MSFIRKLLHDFLMFISPTFIRRRLLSCEQVSHIISENTSLAPIKSVKLKMHLFICKNCLNYKAQMKFLDAQIKNGQFTKIDSLNDANLKAKQTELIEKFSKKILYLKQGRVCPIVSKQYEISGNIHFQSKSFNERENKKIKRKR